MKNRHCSPRAARARSRPPSRFTRPKTQVLKVEIARYISLSEGMSLRDEFVENERTADEPRFSGFFSSLSWRPWRARPLARRAGAHYHADAARVDDARRATPPQCASRPIAGDLWRRRARARRAPFARPAAAWRRRPARLAEGRDERPPAEHARPRRRRRRRRATRRSRRRVQRGAPVGVAPAHTNGGAARPPASRVLALTLALALASSAPRGRASRARAPRARKPRACRALGSPSSPAAFAARLRVGRRAVRARARAQRGGDVVARALVAAAWPARATTSRRPSTRVLRLKRCGHTRRPSCASPPTTTPPSNLAATTMVSGALWHTRSSRSIAKD